MTAHQHVARDDSTTYQPGSCNIGPAEIRRRRQVGHAGLAATLLGLTGLVVIGADPLWRVLLFFPAAISASGYLQAALHFCAGFGSRGIYNFGPLGRQEQVTDADALSRDRAMSNRIGLGAAAIGLVVAVIAVMLPL